MATPECRVLILLNSNEVSKTYTGAGAAHTVQFVTAF